MKTISLTQGKSTMLDDADHDRLSHHSWHAVQVRPGYFYAKRGLSGGKNRFLHHDVIGHPKPGFVVDHINGDTLDNRRANLRFATYSDNTFNKHTPTVSNSGVRGVYARPNGRFIARIGRGGARHMYLGSFSTVEEAAAAVEAAAEMRDNKFALRREIGRLGRQVDSLKKRLAEIEASEAA